MTTILRQNINRCAVLSLSRPESLNCITSPMLDELESHLDLVASDSSRALVITGQGRAFCAGSDLKERHGDLPQRMRQVHRLVERLVNFPKISVAAINGLALGGGLELAMACTFRVAAPAVRLGLPEIKLGVMPVYGGTQLLPRLVGESRALQMMLGGEPISAEQALEYGLIDQLEASPDTLLEAAIERAISCGQYSLGAQQAIRRAIREGMRSPLGEGLQLERTLGAQVAESDDAREGVLAFLEKRAPVFKE